MIFVIKKQLVNLISEDIPFTKLKGGGTLSKFQIRVIRDGVVATLCILSTASVYFLLGAIK